MGHLIFDNPDFLVDEPADIFQIGLFVASAKGKDLITSTLI